MLLQRIELRLAQTKRILSLKSYKSNPKDLQCIAVVTQRKVMTGAAGEM
jgi:hypothetical protein